MGLFNINVQDFGIKLWGAFGLSHFLWGDLSCGLKKNASIFCANVYVDDKFKY